MNLFSDMDRLGLGFLKDMDIIEKEEPQVAKLNKPVPVVKTEEDVIYDKSYICPVCDLPFVSKCVRTGKVKLENKDTDLRPIYDFMDPLKYDAIACDKCGYAAVTRYFGKLSTKQAKELKEKIGKKFSGLNTINPVYSYDDAIIRHKLALVSSMVKEAKNSERAYTCLKLSWVLRGKREHLPKNDSSIKAVYAEELECVQNAYEGFAKAISKEAFPIAGMDEKTLIYIMADLARRLKKYNDATQLLSRLMKDNGTSQRLKDEAYKLNELIKEELKTSDLPSK